ncbi:MAG: iron-containing alcohol dehydrogenase [Candidatus Bathyarchaeia archaeon]
MSFDRARELLEEWRGDSYSFGVDVLGDVGGFVEGIGGNTLLVCSNSDWAKGPLNDIINSLKANRVPYKRVLAARPNCPREDLYRISLQFAKERPDSIVAFGGGSTIDCAKAASVLATFNPEEVSEELGVPWDESCSIDSFFGTGNVSMLEEATGKAITPVVAVQTASGSAAHLTKYSNITDPLESQKKLIVDTAIIPESAVFDYSVTETAPRQLTLDGGLDGISHIWEVFMGSTGKDYYDTLEEIAPLGIRLIVENLKPALKDDMAARVGLGLGTDLGGYSIMIGGTNGPHLGSFSLVDVLTHGRACALLLPYYTLFFSPKIQEQLKEIAPVYRDEGYIKEDIDGLNGLELGKAVALGMIRLNESLGYPTTLREAGAKRDHLERMLEAAKDPQLKMKLLNMPVPLNPEEGDVERYMRGILEAALMGDLSKIKTK